MTNPLLQPQVLASIIQGSCAIIATVIGGVVAAKIGKKFIDQKTLQKKLDLAISDIAFLLGVEKIHNKKGANAGNKNKARDEARNTGLSWSGKFTLGRVKNP